MRLGRSDRSSELLLNSNAVSASAIRFSQDVKAIAVLLCLNSPLGISLGINRPSDTLVAIY